VVSLGGYAGLQKGTLDGAWRQSAAHAGKLVQGKSVVAEVVGTRRAVGRLPDLLHGRHQEGKQNGMDGDDDKQFDYGEAGPSPTCAAPSHRCSPMAT
jgi:hypothetical protein